MPVRLLLIEDNPFDCELASRALAGVATPPGPVEVVSAESWAAAKPTLEAGGLDLVVLDFHLPQMNGLEILRVMQQRPAHPPVIMLTGQNDLATAVETLRAGAYDYVPKSEGFGLALCIAVERVLARVRLEHELAESHARLADYAAELEQKVAARTAVVQAQAMAIEALYLAAEEAARVKVEIIANISHELRTPLNVILGYTDLLEEETRKDSDAHEMLVKIHGQARRLHELVDSLLALGQLRAGKAGIAVSRFSLRGLVDELRADAALLNADKGLTLEWKAPPESCEVTNDREKIRVIAYHLLSNAIKFTHAGNVTLAVDRNADDRLVLTVSDTGIGVSPEARALIFEDFRQLDGSTTRSYEGAGVGLGIVKRYSALLGGTLRFESAAGQGTTVAVELPADVGHPAHRAAHPHRARAH